MAKSAEEKAAEKVIKDAEKAKKAEDKAKAEEEKKAKAEADKLAKEESKGKAKEIEYPVVAGNDRFQAVSFMDGKVVYNPKGQRATGVISEDQAKNLIREYNTAIGIKVKE